MITFGGKIAGRGERDKMHLKRVKERLVDFKTFVSFICLSLRERVIVCVCSNKFE